ncbi:histidine kinase [Teredinibacter waterburyi]|jgi:Membrane protein required for beta-lactamase induction|uniref:histidine kinase n=1 Tax=Teredinibacter waterburyi TaxID=1500538 RepID=UPI00165F20B9|nr:histidine kinase [Teredinibacter waterburyi]
MQLLIVLLAIAFVQVWGARNPLHQDSWFIQWVNLVSARDALGRAWQAPVIIGGPVLAFLLIQAGFTQLSAWLMLPLGVVVLLYSFGRGEFSDIVDEYTKACYVEDWSSALDRAQRLEVDTDDLAENDWSQLHRRVFDEAGYRGFERMFAVLFWFLILGPVGALLYRLMFIYVRTVDEPSVAAARMLWLLEWPVVRLLGLSLSLSGNFVGCFNRLKDCLICVKRSTIDALSPMILGALLVDDNLVQTCEVTRKELNLLNGLYTRTLWMWLAVAALLTILI